MGRWFEEENCCLTMMKMLPWPPTAYFGIALAFLLVPLAVFQPALRITCWTGAAIFAALGVARFALDRREENLELRDREKTITLFPKREVLDEYSVSCDQCGEVFGLGIRACPRCGEAR